MDIRLGYLANTRADDLCPHALVSDALHRADERLDAPAHISFNDQSEFMRLGRLMRYLTDRLISFLALPLSALEPPLGVYRVNIYHHGLLFCFAQPVSHSLLDILFRAFENFITSTWEFLPSRNGDRHARDGDLDRRAHRVGHDAHLGKRRASDHVSTEFERTAEQEDSGDMPTHRTYLNGNGSFVDRTKRTRVPFATLTR